MNVIIEKHSGFGYFDQIGPEKIVYPFLWIEDGVHELNEVYNILIFDVFIGIGCRLGESKMACYPPPPPPTMVSFI